ncbi:MAG: energy-coupling factor ABC transporter permease [Wenzhouxiangellaceae bacterium]|nr:energy-coupling factor ABC transporter permease [Wenzhouxiangellaceae bacterium]
MHIPDGLIAPQAYLPAFALVVPIWAFSVRKVARSFDEALVPRLAVLTALAFVLSSIMLPLPGGTSGHLIGVGLLALAFGLWPAFLTYSLVLALQSLLLGAGGITVLAINALCMGLVGAGVTLLVYRMLARWSRPLAIVIGVWSGVVASSVLVALALGMQPLLGSDAGGQPLFFPFGPAVTLPIIVGTHALTGLGEGLLTCLVFGVFEKRVLATT